MRIKVIARIVSSANMITKLQRWSFQSKWIQIIASFTACLSCFAFSLAFVWPAPAVPKLMSEQSTIVMTTETASWLPTLAMLGVIIGTPISTYLVARFGSKIGVILSCVPSATSWVLIIFARNLETLYVARVLVGFIDSVTFQSVPMYVSEVTSPKIRGMLLSIIPILMLLGNTVTYSVGYVLSIQAFAYGAVAFTLIQLAATYLMPQSPYYLLSIGKEDQARVALEKLRQTTEVEAELQGIKKDIVEETSNTGSVWDLFTVPLNRKSVYLAILITSVQNTCGLTSISSYVHLIFIEAEIDMNEIIPATLFGVVELLSSFITLALVDKKGRRPLLMISCIGLSVCLFFEGGYFFMKDFGYNTQQLKWVPVASLLLYVVFVTIGVGTVPYILYGEIFQMNIKTYGLAFVNIAYGTSGFILTKAFQVVTDGIGMYAIFWIFAGSTLILTAFLYKMIPETKNKTLAEVIEMIDLGKLH